MRSSRLICLAVVAALAAPAAARGDAVTDWNEHAATAIAATAAQPAHASVLSMAMVQGAVYDAVNAIDRGHRPYLAAPRAKRWYSEDAAAATAAFRVLSALFPAQLPTLQPLYDTSLGAVPDGRAKTGGVAVGEAAAAAMLADRANDGRGGPYTFPSGTAPGAWRPAPPAFALDPAPWVGFVRPFLVPDAAMLRTAGPRALGSRGYARDFNEVKEIGSLTSTTRTPDQTMAAVFWQDNPVALWNRLLRSLAGRSALGTADTARLLAMTNLAAADGAIGCWNDKADSLFWRPVVAIREAAGDGNPATDADPAWLPLFDPATPTTPSLVTPGFPEHPSGHTCVSGALLYTLKDFFGTDRMAFSVTSGRFPGESRSFARFTDAIDEIIDARVWGGIHFRTADVQGAHLGRQVARWLACHYFQPVRRGH